ncbi:MAG: DNA polymerase thumb domain-containing protein [Lachnospiraceae bacterium]
MAERTIFHIDVNSAFLSWEACYRVTQCGASLDLRDIPSAVGGDIETRHGIILAKSGPAKKFHIHTGETIVEALNKCPELVIVPPNYELFTRCSKAFVAVLRKYCPVVEPASIDEAYCDVSEVLALHGGALPLAHTIRNEIKEDLGFTVNIGIGPNKLLAKMASDFEKPDKVHTLYPEEIPDKMWPLPVRSLYFVGPATERKLLTLGIRTIGELANAPLSILQSHLKKQGVCVHNYANGIDSTPVHPVSPDAKGYGNSTTLSFDVTDRHTAQMVLLSLCESVGTRLRADSVFACVVAVEIKSFDFDRGEHQLTLPAATNATHEIYQAACRLFDELWDQKTPLRHLGVRVSRITNERTSQMSLFDTDRSEKLMKLDAAIDQIRRTYGTDSIMRASFLNHDLDHYTGGHPKSKKK